MATGTRETVDRTVNGGMDERLARAYGQLETILEDVDLEREPELADEIIDAIEATDRAYTMEAWTAESPAGETTG